MTINTLSSSFSTSLDDVINYATRFRKQYAFIIVVLDHINEQQDHIAKLTSQLYPVLKRNVRTTDTVIRFNQDCWLICLDNCDDHLHHWTHYVLETMLHRRKLQMTSFEGTLTYVYSDILKANTRNQATRIIDQAIEVAKNALRRQKTIRSTAIVPGDSHPAAPINYVPLVNKAMLDNRLFLAFQPVVESTSGTLHHYECLARVLDEQDQMLPAYQFIPQCERSGFIQVIDQRILQLAIEELMNSHHIRLAINVSAITASDPLWLTILKTHMASCPDLRGRLMIELTETSVFADIDESVQFMTQLRDLGCPVSIDDFGTGYMSLGHIKSDLVQTIKIDAQFVRNLKEDPNNIHFIRAITALTQPYGLNCIAEGVEDEETATLLTQENVDFLQGYHIGKPSPLRKWV